MVLGTTAVTSHTWPAGLTHWGRVTHICVGNLTIIGSDNGLSPERRQAIIWTNAGILLIGPLGTNLSEILVEIQTFSLKKIHLKMSSAKCCSFRLGLNVSMEWFLSLSWQWAWWFPNQAPEITSQTLPWKWHRWYFSVKWVSASSQLLN